MATDTLQAAHVAANDDTWREALGAWRKALDNANWLTKALDAVTEAHDAIRPQLDEIEPIARKHFPHQNVRFVAYTLDLEQHFQRVMEGEGKTWWARDPEARKAELRGVIDTIADFRRRETEADEATGYHALNDRYDAAWDAETEARSRLFKTPAPDAEGALLKLDLLFGPDAMDRSGEGEAYCDSWTAEWVGPSMDDVKRLLSKAA